MSQRKRAVIFLCTLFLTFDIYAQNLRIEEDTIYVTDEIRPMLYFGGEIRKADLLCASDNYRIPSDAKDIRILPNKSNPKSPCGLYIEEGNRDNPNAYRFVIVYKREGDYPDSYKYNTEERINARIAELERRKKNDVRIVGTKSESKSEVKPDSKYGPEEYKGDLAKELNISMKELEEKVTKKIQKFNDRRDKIVNDRKNADVHMKYIVEQVFNNCSNCQITTISKKKGAEVFSLTDYLVKLRGLGGVYQKVNYNAEKVQLIGPVREGVDGKFYATAEIYQKFEGGSATQVGKDQYVWKYKKYTDITYQTAQIEIVVYEAMDENDHAIRKFDVFLTELKGQEIR